MSDLYNSYKVTVSGKQKFMGIEIPIIEGGFGEGKRCLTDKTIAQIHGMKIFNIRKRLSDNIKRFKEGVDIIDLKRICEINTLTSLGYAKQSITQAEHIYLLSERGYAKLIKIMDTDLAWDIHDKLVDEYFAMREQLTKLSKEDMTWLELKHSGQDGNAQYLINHYLGQAQEIIKDVKDLDGKKLILGDLAEEVGKEIEMKVDSSDITEFLITQGYFIKRYFPKIANGKVSKMDVERNAHRQPTEQFKEFTKEGLAITKEPDIRGKVMWEFTKRFAGYFKDNFLEDFIYFLQVKKGWK